MKPTPFTTLAELIERYDVFLIDQFGVLRDNNGLYEGASKALKTLKAANKVVVILSNSGKDGDSNARRIVDLGIERASFDHFVTSGDVGLSILKRPGSPAKPGGRCLTIASADAPDYAELLGMVPADTGCDADLVLIAGSEAERTPMEKYAALLRRAAERDVACFCTNPDLRKLWNGASVPAAGSIANLYEALGGQVTRLGKPFQEIYDYVLQLCDDPEKSSVVCVGDSIEHDILGARRAGLSSVLVSTGLAARQTLEAQARNMEEINAWPTYRMTQFSGIM